MKDLFNKITGNVDDDLYGDYEEEQVESLWDEEEETQEDRDRDLLVDVYQDEDNLYIKAFVPGIEPSSLDIDITRDNVTIKGTSFRDSAVGDENYFRQELSWGTYSKSINLPREIDIEMASASSRDGTIHLILPKIDKDRRTKLRIG